eukprot:TRINITY_DN5432_c0_g1_i1.p1 TRINITY_DN5432_c0_g1~~TRINITY_DN5432_c0_g1_i1.p1  ORF type:complete len:176 (+),score=34.55 TRINITY_DN5432_c0_g1_i1:56-529(+)
MEKDKKRPHKANNNNLLKPALPRNSTNPSLLHSKGGVGYHSATVSGQNIIRGLEPYQVPDLPPEKAQKQYSNNSNNNKSDGIIANLGVDINNDNSKAASGGIGGFLGKVYNGWSARRRAQSTENSSSLSPDNMKDRTRSKSPFGRSKNGQKRKVRLA